MSIPAFYGLSCKTTPALYSFLLVILKKLEQQYGKNLQFDECINAIQLLFVNHQPYSQSELIKQIQALKLITQEEQKAIIAVIERSCQDPVSDEVRWENPFHRYFESFLAIELLNSPTQQTLQAVKLISHQIIHLLKSELLKQPDLLKSFLHYLSSQTQEPELFFKFSQPILTVEELINILEQNEPHRLGSILAIHYVFARFVFRQLQTESTKRPISLSDGALLNHLKTNFPQYITEQQQLTAFTEEIHKEVFHQWIRPEKFFGSLKKTRGRGPFNEWVSSNKLGLLLEHQIPNQWPSLNKEQAWSPDALCQSPDISSPVVQRSLSNDLLYIAGPSGMTTLFLVLAELLGGLSLDLKESYVLAVIAYISGGGLHAINEVLVIAHHLYGYFGAYKENQYQTFFEHFNQDDSLKTTVDRVWDRFLIQCGTFFKENTVPEFLQHQFCWSDPSLSYSKHHFFKRRKVHIELKRANREYFETLLAQTILEQTALFPTVQKISLLILNCLNAYRDQAVVLIQTNPLIRKELYDKEYFGKLAYPHPTADSAQDVFNQLAEVLANPKADLIEVIHVHAVFIRQFFKPLNISEELNAVLKSYEEQLFPNSWKTPEGRGRIVHNPNPQLTKRLGISRNKAFQALVGESKEAHRCGIDEFRPCPQSLFFKAIKKTDIPFVSGLSGHTAQLLSCALICALWDKQVLTENELKEYFISIAAYLIAGANHSFHEAALVFAQLGVSYQPGVYHSLLPNSFSESQAFKDLLARFPEYLDESNRSFLSN